tara:strand:+ start:84 stop:395 length:312 start_codon:yes stop_codon:yes gene_type:complete
VALRVAVKILERLIREAVKNGGIEAGIAMGKQLKAPQRVVSLAISRASKKNPYGTFAQRKAARIQEAEMARSNPMVRRNAPFSDEDNMLLRALRSINERKGNL